MLSIASFSGRSEGFLNLRHSSLKWERSAITAPKSGTAAATPGRADAPDVDTGVAVLEQVGELEAGVEAFGEVVAALSAVVVAGPTTVGTVATRGLKAEAEALGEGPAA